MEIPSESPSKSFMTTFGDRPVGAEEPHVACTWGVILTSPDLPIAGETGLFPVEAVVTVSTGSEIVRAIFTSWY